MARHRDATWNLPEKPETWEQVAVAVLMDIREKLSPLERLDCPATLGIPLTLRRIERAVKAKPKPEPLRRWRGAVREQARRRRG